MSRSPKVGRCHDDTLAGRPRALEQRISGTAVTGDGPSSTGFIALPGILNRSLCGGVAREIAGIDMVRPPQEIGSVVQELEMKRLSLSSAPPRLQELGSWLRSEFLHRWMSRRDAIACHWPNEVTVARYQTGEGISPHRDHGQYRYLVAICSISGIGRFQVVSDRTETTVLQEHVAKPGDVILMSAGSRQLSPMHSVNTLKGPRISVSFRYDHTATGSPTSQTR